MFCYNNYPTSRLILVVLLSWLVILLAAGVGMARPVSEAAAPELHEGIFNFNRNNGQIVINDRLFSVDKDTHYVTKEGQSITLKSFGEGDKVLFSASEDRIVKELQLQEKVIFSRKQPVVRHEPIQKQEIHLENGVWRN